MQCRIMVIINVHLSLQLRVNISWHGNLQGREKVFLAGRIEYVGARKSQSLDH